MRLYEYEAICQDIDGNVHHYDGVFEASGWSEAKRKAERESERVAEMRDWNFETSEVMDLRFIPDEFTPSGEH